MAVSVEPIDSFVNGPLRKTFPGLTNIAEYCSGMIDLDRVWKTEVAAKRSLS